MDKAVLWQLSYGVYAIGINDNENGRATGCIANTVFQLTSEPALIALSMNKNNYTHQMIEMEKIFTISVLSEETAPVVISTLGFRSGKDMDKFANVSYLKTASGVPYADNNICGYMEAKVVDSFDTPTHTVFVAEVADAVKVSDQKPMTYEYYHKVVKGKAPKNAPTYQKL